MDSASGKAGCFSWEGLLRATSGSWSVRPSPDAAGVCGVTDDSRRVGRGSLFVAIEGELADGHRYIRQAVEAGAVGICLQRGRELEPGVAAALSVSGLPVLEVPDTLRAFQELARAHRASLPGLRVVGVTGSCGKTSTKEMLAVILETAWPGAVLKTEGNTNNHFGVPRNLLRLQAGHQAAVLELGTNHPGEVSVLARLVLPDVGVVTSVARVHLEFLGSLAGVAAEKGDLFRFLPDTGVAVVPTAAPHGDILRRHVGPRRVLTFGEAAGADVRFEYLGLSEGSVERYRCALHWAERGSRREFEWPLGGKHQAANAAAAAAAATALGVEPDLIAAALPHTRLPRMRMEKRSWAGVVWVNDAYNANPDSMRASVEWFRESVAGQPRELLVLVLGDMFELGAVAESEHVGLLHWVQEALPGASVIPFGPAMSAVAGRCGLRGSADLDETRRRIEESLRPGTWVLLKGSRGMHLERLLPAELRQVEPARSAPQPS